MWIVILGAVASMLVPMSSMLRGSYVNMAVGLFLLGVVIVVAVVPLFTTSYSINQTHLIVKFGLMRWRVPLADIRSVSESNDPTSAPALSLQRVKIAYGAGSYILVSPNDRSAFIQALNASRLQARPPPSQAS